MPPEGDPKPAFTPEQGEELNKILGATVNNMLTARLKTFEKQLHEKIGSSIGETLTKTLDEKLAGFKQSAADDEGGKDGKGKKGESVELATLRRQMSELTQRTEESDRRYAAERAKNRAATLKDASQSVLATHGIDGNKFRVAFAVLQQDGRIRYAADDSDDLVFVDDAGNEVDLAVGLKSWVKTEDAKMFLPPSGTRGSGSRPGNGTAPTAPVSREQAQTNAMNYLSRALQSELRGGAIEQDET